MPKLSCICGSIIDLSAIPHMDGFMILTEASVDELIDSAEALHREADSESAFRRGLSRLLTPLSQPAPHIYQCSNCGRLAILRHPSDLDVGQWYSPEGIGDNDQHLLRSMFDPETSESPSNI